MKRKRNRVNQGIKERRKEKSSFLQKKKTLKATKNIVVKLDGNILIINDSYL